MPNINDLKQEYLTQNTVNYIMGNQLAQSDVEQNPNRYVILGSSDQDSARGEVYNKDEKAYYPYSAPESRTATLPPTSPEAKMRYGNSNVYPLDQKPYYGPNGDYRVIVDMPNDKVAVPIEFGDLSQTHADETNLRKMQSQLENLNRQENINSVSESGKYLKDPRAYFDPTAPEKAMLKAQLAERIENMKQELLNPAIPKLELENVASKLKVQNYPNKNKEETNELIANSYYYPIQKDQKGFDLAGPVGSNVKQLADNRSVSVSDGNTRTFKELVKDGSVIGVKAEKKTYSNIITAPNGVVLQESSKKQKEPQKKNEGTVFPQNSKYIEADENAKTVTEAESVGEVLGNKYVENESVKRPMVEAESVEKKIVEAEETNKNKRNDNAYRQTANATHANQTVHPINNTQHSNQTVHPAQNGTQHANQTVHPINNTQHANQTVHPAQNGTQNGNSTQKHIETHTINGTHSNNTNGNATAPKVSTAPSANKTHSNNTQVGVKNSNVTHIHPTNNTKPNNTLPQHQDNGTHSSNGTHKPHNETRHDNGTHHNANETQSQPIKNSKND